MMKRILSYLFCLGFGLISVSSFADDINFLLSNRVDVAQTNTRPQVLFIIDVLEDSALASRSDEDSSVTYRDNEPGSCYTIGSRANGFVMSQLQLQYPSEGDAIYFSGELCSNGKQATKVTTTTRRTWDELTTKDPREIIKYIMRQRPDLEYGVISLNDYVTPASYTTSANLDLEVAHRADLAAAFSIIDGISSHSGDSTPITGGLAVAYDYLSDSTNSPLSDSCADMKLVLITNGGWKNDIGYATTSDLRTDVTNALGNTTSTSAYLQAIANYIRNNNVKSGCTARVSTSVYGVDAPDTEQLFSGSAPVGQEMADVGNGVFLNAETGGEIARSVLDDLDHSYPDPLSLSSPAVAVAVDRASHKPTAYATAFEPLKNQRWYGNITDADLSNSSDETLDPVSGTEVGAKEFDNSFIATKTAASRIIKTNIGSSTLRTLSGIVGSAETIITSDDYSAYIQDLPGGLADPIHFKPLAIDYGGSTGIRLVVGTNDGLLHMFDSSGNELWAFLPKELEKLVPALANGNTAPSYMMVDHFYGVDGAPTAFIYDAPDENGIRDGEISASGADKVLIFFGLRRGGGSYYAMDITNPELPELLWTKGSMNIDYGSKFDISTGSSTEGNVVEENVVVVESAGGCPVFGMYPENGLISSGLVSYSCPPYAPTLVGSNESFDDSTWLTKLAAVGGSSWVYFAGMGIGNQHSGSCSATTPIFTQHNQCKMDLSGATGFTFEAHPAAMYSIEKPSSTGCHTRASRDFDGMAVGDDGEGESIGFVGFDMSSLPSNAYITSARITMAHTASNSNTRAGAAYDQVVAIHGRPEYYGKGITIAGAGKTAEGGPGRDSSASFTSGQCADWDDNNHYQYIGQIGDPNVANYAVSGLRTADGEIYPADLYPHFYDGGVINDKGISALTQLFNHRVGDGYGHSWTQFKLQVANLSGTSLVAYETPVGGEQIEDYANGAGYWANTVPKLILTWQTDLPTTAATASEMEMSGADFWAVRGSGSFDGDDGDSGDSGDSGGSGGSCSVSASCQTHVDAGRLDGRAGGAAYDWNGSYLCSTYVGGDVLLYNHGDNGSGKTVWNKTVVSCESVTTYTVTASAGANGNVSPVSTSVESGSSATITVTADPGYQIADVIGCSGTLSGTIYTTGSITANCAVSATFEAAAANTYTVSTNAGSNGGISPSSATVTEGNTTQFTITPNGGYQIDTVSGCGGSLSGSTYTTGTVNAACTVSATFEAIPATTYTVSVNAGLNGGISPSSATVNEGNTTQFTVTPNSGYQIASVSGCGGSLSGDTYTTGAINAACTVSATFEAVPATTYTVSASAGSNGGISPSSATVTEGNTTQFTVTPSGGYQIASVTGCSGTLSGSSYTTGAINSACTVTASFEAEPSGATCTQQSYSPPSTAPSGHVSNCGFSEACAAGDSVKVNYSYYAGTATVYINSADNKGYSSLTACQGAN